MLNIRSKKIIELKESLDNGVFSKKEWDIFSSLNEDDIVELIDKINVGLLPEYYFKIYFTVYSEDIIKNVELRLKDDINLNKFFSHIWENTSFDAKPEELSEAMMGCVIFNTDFINRIKKGFSLNLNNIKKLDKQIEELIIYYNDNIDLNNFYNVFFQSEDKLSDNEILKNNDTFSNYVLKNINKIKTSVLYLELYSLLNNTNNYSVQEIKEHEEYLKNEIEKYNFEVSLNDLNFLNDSIIVFIDNYLSNKFNFKEDNYLLINENSKISFSVKKDEFEEIEEPTESKILTGINNFLNKEKSKKEHKIENKININEFLLNKKKNKFPVAKVLISIFVLSIIIAWGAIIQSKHSSNDSNSNSNLIERKINAANFQNEKFEINREGTNKHE